MSGDHHGSSKDEYLSPNKKKKSHGVYYSKLKTLIKEENKVCVVKQPRKNLFSDPWLRFANPVWLSRESLIAHTRIGDGFFEDPYELDIRTGNTTYLPKLAKRINDLKGTRWQFSTDRKWILYRKGWLSKYSIVAVSRDGTQTYQWEINDLKASDEYFWIPERYQWIQFSDKENRIRYYKLGNPFHLEEEYLKGLNKRSLLGFRSKKEIVFCGMNNFDRIDISYISVLDKCEIRRKTLSVGKGEISDWLLSPNGHSLVFLRHGALWVVRLDENRVTAQVKV